MITLNLWAKEAKDYWDREKSNALKDKKALPLETTHKLNHKVAVVGNNKGVIIDFISGITDYNILKQFIGRTNVANNQFQFLDYADETDGINTTFRKKLLELQKNTIKDNILTYGRQICEERSSEGVFINETLGTF